MRTYTKLYIVAILGSLSLTACTVAKLEARLEANPQCKDVINPKTGAVMPCPGTDKSFYRSVGLEPAKASVPAGAPQATATAGAVIVTDSAPISSSPSAASPGKPYNPGATTPADCKPQLHKKTGGMLPCPTPD